MKYFCLISDRLHGIRYSLELLITALETSHIFFILSDFINTIHKELLSKNISEVVKSSTQQLANVRGKIAHVTLIYLNVFGIIYKIYLFLLIKSIDMDVRLL